MLLYTATYREIKVETNNYYMGRMMALILLKMQLH